MPVRSLSHNLHISDNIFRLSSKTVKLIVDGEMCYEGRRERSSLLIMMHSSALIMMHIMNVDVYCKKDVLKAEPESYHEPISIKNKQ